MKGIGQGFPWATLAVNLFGCLVIGLLWGFTAYITMSVLAGIALVATGYYLTR